MRIHTWIVILSIIWEANFLQMQSDRQAKYFKVSGNFFHDVGPMKINWLSSAIHQTSVHLCLKAHHQFTLAKPGTTAGLGDTGNRKSEI